MAQAGATIWLGERLMKEFQVHVFAGKFRSAKPRMSVKAGGGSQAAVWHQRTEGLLGASVVRNENAEEFAIE